MTRSPLGALVRGFGAFVGLVVLVLGVPAALAAGVGWPLPHAVPTVADLHRLFAGHFHPAGSFYLKVVAVVAWIAWLEVAACAIAEVRAAIGGRRAWRVRFAGPIQPLVAALVAAIVLALPPGGGEAPAHAPSLAVALSATGPPRRAVLVADDLNAHRSKPEADHHPRPREDGAHERGEPVTVTVRQRDTLWGLAEQYLGNPLDWREIFDLNLGKPQPGGGSLTDPSLIRVGWVLELPPRAGHHLRDGHHPTTHRPEPRREASEPPQHRPHIRTHRPPVPKGGNGKRPTATGTSRPHSHNGTSARRKGATTAHTAEGLLVELPSGGVVSVSFLAGVAAAVALGRLRRRRGYRPRPPAPGWSGRASSPAPLLASMLRAGRRTELSADDDGDEEKTAEQPAAPTVDVAVPLGSVLAGTRDGVPMVLALASGGIGLDGPGAGAVARALVADVVTRHLPGHVEVLVVSELWPDLLSDVNPFPGLRRVERLEDALREAEVELIRRVRSLEDEELPDLAAYWLAHPEDPVPVLFLVTAGPASSLDGRLGGILEIGRRAGIGALVLATGASTKTTAVVDSDGMVTSDDASAELRGSQLVLLEREELATALEAVGAVRRVDDEPTAEEDEQVEATMPAVLGAELPISAADAPVRVSLLGSYCIDAAGVEVRTGLRRKSRELLAWFCCHPDGGTEEAVVEALWPDGDPGKVRERFWNALGNLRTRLRDASGAPELLVVDRSGSRYRAVEGELDVDLWAVQRALSEASTAPNDEAASAALDRAVSLYSGDLLADADWLWAEPQRDEVRSRLLDALVRLGEVHEQAGDLDAAAAALERATTYDPYAEEIYRRRMRLQLAYSRPEAARRTLRELTARLDELGLDPDEETLSLVARRRAPITSPSTASLQPPLSGRPVSERRA